MIDSTYLKVLRLVAYIAVSLLPVLLLACAGPRPEPVVASLGEEVSLQVGQEATFGDELRVKFLRVQSDDRCPPAARCSQEGSAGIALQVQPVADQDGSSPRSISMSLRGSSPWVRGFDVDTESNGEPRLVGYEYTWGLCPYPDSDRPRMRRQGDYRLHFRVRAVEGPVGEVDIKPITVPCAE